MNKDDFSVSIVLPVNQKRLYAAWLDSKEHSAFTGSTARISPTAWDGYINGVTMELEPYRRIVQAWRTTEFPKNAPDSILEIIITKVEKGTRLTLNHTDIPPGQGDEYKKGWKDYYFSPMKEYFSR